MKVKGAGKGGGTTENGCECGSKGPQVRSPAGGRLVVAGACCLLLRDSARGGLPTEVLGLGEPKGRGGVTK